MKTRVRQIGGGLLRAAVLGMALASASVRAADLSCAPSPAAGQAVLTLGRAAGVRADSAAQMLARLSEAQRAAPGTVSLLKVALSSQRMPTDTYVLLTADLAVGPGHAPTLKLAKQILLLRGGVLPLQACLTVPELNSLLRGERTALEDSYRTPAARTRP